MTALDSANGSSPSSGSGLAEAVTRHAKALVKVNTHPNGMVQIDVMQMFCDLALAELRIELLFEALRDKELVEPHVLVKQLCDKLHQEAQNLENLAHPQIAIASGRVPRNDG